MHSMVSSFLPVANGEAFDVVVVGGGVSGCMAALASARDGARTLLIEAHGFVGGSLTAMGVGPMMSFHNGAGQQLVKGLPQEIIDRLQRRGASLGHIPDTTTYCSTVTPFDSEALKIELEAMLEEASVRLLYHTQLAAVERSDTNIASVVVCNKAGLTRFTARVFIDASGDGDLSERAGATFVMGRTADQATQPMTMNLKIGGVDISAIKDYVQRNPDDFLWEHGQQTGLERLQRAQRISLAGFLRAWNAAKARGEIDIPRDQVLFFETATPGVVIVNTSRIQGLNATDPFQLTRAEIIGRRQCTQIFAFLRQHCVGFENSIRMDTSANVGVRESRHVSGLYQLTAEDLLREKDFPDAIALGGYPIDIHSPDDAITRTTKLPQSLAYRIPLRSLIAKDVNNLVLVGRCLSATHEASAAIRVTPIAMAIGQAGGTLAALACSAQQPPHEVDAREVRRVLVANGAIVSVPAQ
jgi:hypothetical protein